ncbi:transporter substrate-binding domain-containing protein [Paraburkholderia sp. JHI869]|uniref:transporter substrate-binding domain-containing protein n=1 Tax=Paraburkholderia sp. JHI869 TaxID=3112959 RepID=UPI003170874B
MKIKTLLIALFATSIPLSTFADDGKELKFGVDSAYPPFESKTPSGQLVGFDIDLGHAICAKLKRKCVWVENSFDGMIPALQARNFDAINSSMSRTGDRAKAVDFSDKLYANLEALVVKGGSTLVAVPEALKGARIGVLQGSTQEVYARKHWTNGTDVVGYPSQDQVWNDLAAGRLDAALASDPTAESGFLKTAQGRDFGFARGPAIRDIAIFGPGVSIAVRKGDKALLEAINSAIASIREDGTYDRIAKKYFSFDIYGG